jgi:hypothetical protein
VLSGHGSTSSAGYTGFPAYSQLRSRDHSREGQHPDCQPGLP